MYPDSGKQGLQAEELRWIAESFEKLFQATLVGLVGSIVLIVFLIAYLGFAFTQVFGADMWNPETWTPTTQQWPITGGGFEGEDPTQLLFEMFKLFLPIILALAIFSAILGYLYMQGGDILKHVSRVSDKPQLVALGSTGTLIYWGGLLVLIGGITTIIIIGVFLMLIGVLLLVVGLVMLGLEVRRWGPRYETPGLLVAVGAILSLVSSFAGDIGIVASIVGDILLLVGLHELKSAALIEASTQPAAGGPGQGI